VKIERLFYPFDTKEMGNCKNRKIILPSKLVESIALVKIVVISSSFSFLTTSEFPFFIQKPSRKIYFPMFICIFPYINYLETGRIDVRVFPRQIAQKRLYY
jgi:hypothetical protein